MDAHNAMTCPICHHASAACVCVRNVLPLDPGDCPACRQPYDAQERAEERVAGYAADAVRLRAELRALVEVGDKLRADSERASGQALDLGREHGRVERMLDDAEVPRSAALPCRPWRQDDRVAWVLEQLRLRNDLVDHLEAELSQARVDLAQLQQQHARLQLSACRVVSGGPAHG